MEATAAIEAEVMGLSEADRAAERARLRQLFESLQDDRSLRRTYIAFVDGEPAGAARGTFTNGGINLSGGTVLTATRGRGVYRALVEASWRDAVARGTPALTVQAGKMSRPILERLGFTTVTELFVFCDRFT